jgi:preprotein translocase subunit SecY
MLETLRSAWRIKELRQRITFTLLMLVVFRLGSHVPVPGVDPSQIANFFQQNNLFGLFNVFAGGSLETILNLCHGYFPLY